MKVINEKPGPSGHLPTAPASRTNWPLLHTIAEISSGPHLR